MKVERCKNHASVDKTFISTDRYLSTIQRQSVLSCRYAVLDWFESSCYPGLKKTVFNYWTTRSSDSQQSSSVILFTVLQELPEWENLQRPKVSPLRRWRRGTPGLRTSPSQTATWRTVSPSSPERTSPRERQVKLYSLSLGQFMFTRV